MGQLLVRKFCLGGACNLFVYTTHVCNIHPACNDELYCSVVKDVKIYSLHSVHYFDLIGYILVWLTLVEFVCGRDVLLSHSHTTHEAVVDSIWVPSITNLQTGFSLSAVSAVLVFCIKSSRACSLFRLETKSVCETVHLIYLTRLSAREDFTVLSSGKLPLFGKFISSLFNNIVIVDFEKHQTLKLQLTFSMCEGKILLCFTVLCNLLPL
jgi:hypothetical protein